MEAFEPLLQSAHTKKNALDIVNVILKDNTRLPELLDLFFHKDKRICQRASWSIGLLGEKNPELLKPYFSKMLKYIKEPVHDAVVRNTLRTWSFMGIPEDYEGDVYDFCYDCLTDTTRAVAIRIFSISILTGIAIKYPELKKELIPALEDHYPHGTAGLQSRTKRALKRLHKN